jgi:hypothetical protein
MNIKNLLFILSMLNYVATNAQPPKSDSAYKKYVDSLYQINIKIAMDYGKALETNPNAVRPEPAIWFVDMDGNMYDYPPDAENDSIMKAREAYKRKLDSLGGKQFIEIEKWYNEKHKK